MTHRVPIWTAFFALLLVFASPQLLVAQELDAMVAQAVKLFERGRPDEALAKLKAVLAKDPSSEDAFRMFDAIEFHSWARMLAHEGELSKAVMELMSLGRPAATHKVADSSAIKELVAELDSPDWGKRNAAFRNLAANHGEYTVPYLLSRLGSDDPNRRAAAMQWLRRLGVQAVLPLIAALKIDNKRVRAGALTVLGQIGDHRADPYVVQAAGAKGLVGEVARDAAARLKPGQDLKASFLGLAEAYYRGSVAVIDPFRGLYPIWRCLDGKHLSSHEVPRDLYGLKLAEQTLFDVLALYPGDFDTRVLLSSVLIREGLGSAPAGGDEGSARSPLANAASLAAAGGAGVLDGVVAKALQDQRPTVAVGALEMLGSMLDADSFSAPNGATDALSSQNKAVRFAAALAISRIAPRSGFAGSAMVVPVLREALGQSVVRTALIVDDNHDTNSRLVRDLNARGWFASAVTQGPLGLARLREFPVEDLMIVRYNLQDSSVNQIIRMVKGGGRTSSVPVVLLVPANLMAEARKNYEGKVQGFIEQGSLPASFEPGLRKLLPPLDAARAQADKLAAAAARALAALDPKAPFLSSASAREALQGVLQKSDMVRIPAMEALGRIADPASVPALLKIFQDGSASEAVRGSAALALARCVRSGGSVSGEVGAALGAAIKGEGGHDYMLQLARAIGMAPFKAAQRASLLKALRSRILVDTMK